MSKLNSLQKGLILDMPLTSTWLQSSTVASDRSANNNTGTATGTPPTFDANGTNLNGSSDYVLVADSADITFGDGTTDSAFSISAWVNVDTASGVQPILDKSNSTTVNEYALYFAGDQTLRFDLYDSDDNNLIGMYSDGDEITALVGTWAHVVATYSAATQTTADMTTYINGSAVTASGATTGTYVAMEDTASSMKIGQRLALSTQYLDGRIQNVKIYNRELSAAEVTTLYNQGRTEADQKVSSLFKGLLAYFPLTDTYLQTSTLPSDVSSLSNHSDTADGTPTFSSTGMDADKTTSVNGPATNIFDNASSITIALKFTPDTSADSDTRETIMDTTNGSRYSITKLQDASNNVLRIQLGNTTIVDIALATYTAYWDTTQENSLIISGTTGDTSVWMNGNQIVSSNSTAWSAKSAATLYLCSDFNTGNRLDGELRDLAIWNRVLTAAERAQYENSQSLLI